MQTNPRRAAGLALTTLIACSSVSDPPTTPTSGHVRGLQQGARLTLESGTGTVSVVGSGSGTDPFAFSTALGKDELTITPAVAAPAGNTTGSPVEQRCTITSDAAASEIVVTCATVPHHVSVALSSVATGSSVTIRIARTATAATSTPGDDVKVAPPLTEDGAHVFGLPILSDQQYAVSIVTQPAYDPGSARRASQNCTVGANATGTIGSADVSVDVTCVTNEHQVTGKVTGYDGADVTPLQLSEGGGGATLTCPSTSCVATSTPGEYTFRFPPRDSGSSYAVEVVAGTPSSNQSCEVTSQGNGALPSAGKASIQNDDVTGVTVACDKVPCSQGGSCTVFVTSSIHTGDLKGEHADGLAGADAICAARALEAGLAGTFKAWISHHPDTPATHFTKATGPYKRVDGVVVANGWADLTSCSPTCLAAPIAVAESGTLLTDVRAMSNTKTDGTDASGGANDCQAWTSNDTTMANYGVPTATNAEWAHRANSINCSGYTGAGNVTVGYRLYCFEQ